MINLDPSTISEDATENVPVKPTATPEGVTNTETPEPPANAEEHKKRVPLVWIPVTLGIGLLIAAIYLGARIVTAHKDAKPAVVSAAITPPVVAPTPVKPPVNTEAPATPQPISPQLSDAASPAGIPAKAAEQASDDSIPMISPHTGERYIQVGALDAEATRRFIKRLRGKNLEPQVAPGPKPELLRVLIGPFDNREALDEKKAQIENEGMDNFVRKY